MNQALIRPELPADAALQDAAADLGLKTPQWRGDEGYTQGLGVQWLQSQSSLGL